MHTFQNNNKNIIRVCFGSVYLQTMFQREIICANQQKTLTWRLSVQDFVFVNAEVKRESWCETQKTIVVLKKTLFFLRWPVIIVTAPNSYGFIAQLVEHCTGIAKVTGSNPAEA